MNIMITSYIPSRKMKYKNRIYELEQGVLSSVEKGNACIWNVIMTCCISLTSYHIAICGLYAIYAYKLSRFLRRRSSLIPFFPSWLPLLILILTYFPLDFEFECIIFFLLLDFWFPLPSLTFIILYLWVFRVSSHFASFMRILLVLDLVSC